MDILIRDNKPMKPKKPKTMPKPKIVRETKFPRCPRTGEGKCHCDDRPKKIN